MYSGVYCCMAWKNAAVSGNSCHQGKALDTPTTSPNSGVASELLEAGDRGATPPAGVGSPARRSHERAAHVHASDHRGRATRLHRLALRDVAGRQRARRLQICQLHPLLLGGGADEGDVGAAIRRVVAPEHGLFSRTGPPAEYVNPHVLDRTVVVVG